MSSQYPGGMAALSPSSVACSLCPGPDPTADLSWLAPLSQAHRAPGTAGAQTLATGSTEDIG